MEKLNHFSQLLLLIKTQFCFLSTLYVCDILFLTQRREVKHKMKSALIRMRESMETASATERVIMEHLLKNPEAVLANSIHALAKRTFSSPATILRMCRRVGFEGYKEFRQAVTSELALRQHSRDEEKKEITRLDSLEDIVDKITYKNIVSLEDSRNLIEIESVRKAVDLISSCKTIYLYGIGSSLCVARDLYLKFLRLGKPCVLNDDWHSQLLQARNSSAEDLGIVFSYSGQTVEVVECMKEMRVRGCPMISITRYGTMPVTELSTLPLYVAANESIFRSGAMSSRISQLNLNDILYTEYANRSYEKSMAQLSFTHIQKPGQSFGQHSRSAEQTENAENQ
jgi:DNA-binding MurR/RpiR family transcriptional regulator